MRLRSNARRKRPFGWAAWVQRARNVPLHTCRLPPAASPLDSCLRGKRRSLQTEPRGKIGLAIRELTRDTWSYCDYTGQTDG